MLSVVVERQQGIQVVCPELDRLDLDMSRSFIEAFADGIDPRQTALLDLCRVRHCDSTGFGALLSCRARLVDHGGRLVVCSLNEPIARMYSILGIDRIIPVFADRAEALRWLGEPIPPPMIHPDAPAGPATH